MTDAFEKIIQNDETDKKFRNYLDKCDTIEKKIVLCEAFLKKYKIEKKTEDSILSSRGNYSAFTDEYSMRPRDMYINNPPNINIITETKHAELRYDVPSNSLEENVVMERLKREAWEDVYSILNSAKLIEWDSAKDLMMNRLSVRLRMKVVNPK